MKQIILIRKDLRMGVGKCVAQGAHASMKATLENLGHPSVKEWLAGPFTKIVVGVGSEEVLIETLRLAKEAGLITSLIVDAGRTEFHGIPTVTCGAVGPASSEELNPITGKFTLL